MSNLNLDVIIPKECTDTIRLRVGAEIDLSRLPANVKRPIVTALHRGHTTALTGIPVWHYKMLAYAFEFPVFQLGRTDRCVLSYTSDKSKDWVDGLVADLKNMWRLTLTTEQKRNAWHDHWFRSYAERSPNSNWWELEVTRPQQLTMDSICTFMGVGDIKDLVPLDRRMAALLAVEQGQRIDVSRFVRGVPK